MEAYAQYADAQARVIALSGELDASDPDWAAQLQDAVDSGATCLVVDLRNVTFIDSSVIRGLVLLHRQVRTDGWLRLVYTHHLIRRVIDICGLAEAFPQFTTPESALRDHPSRMAAAHDGVGRSPGQVRPHQERDGGGDPE